MSRTTAAAARRRIVTLAAIGVAGLCSLVAVPTASAAQVGAVADITWGQPRAAVDREIAMLKAGGVRWVRTNINWAGLEAEGKGRISAGQLAEYDYAVEQARAAGLEVLMPISDGVPYWASGDPRKYVDGSGRKHWDRFWPPANMADYGDVVGFVAARYTPKGVHAYEIWNEPNTAWFWASGPDPAAYVSMLKAGHQAVKRVDPAATVIMGGLAKNDFRYLEGVYRAGGGAYFDAVAVHPYTYGVDPTVGWRGANAGEDPSRLSLNSFPAIQEIKRTMDAHGDVAKKVWLTEFGYSTTTADGGVSEAQQAAFLTKAFEYLEQFEWVHSAFWYAARNSPFLADADDYEAQFGLTRIDFTPKPSYYALKSYAATTAATAAPAPAPAPTPAPTPDPAPAPVPSVPSPAPAPTPVPSTPAAPAPVPVPVPPANNPPTVALTAPVGGARFATQLRVAASAEDDTRVARVEFHVDGRSIGSDRTAPYVLTWQVPRKIALGRHVLTVRAVDESGRSASASVEVVRVEAAALAVPTVRMVSATHRATPRRQRSIAVTGSVPRGGARSWLRFERLSSSKRWVPRHTRPVAAHKGSYRTVLRPSSGRWRVRLVTAKASRRMASPYRTFLR